MSFIKKPKIEVIRNVEHSIEINGEEKIWINNKNIIYIWGNNRYTLSELKTLRDCIDKAILLTESN